MPSRSSTAESVVNETPTIDVPIASAAEGGAGHTASTPAETRAKAVDKIISSATRWSAAGAAIPVPLLDLAVLGGVQVKMIRNIADLYGQTLDVKSLKPIVAVLLGTLVPGALAGNALASASKAMPGFGVVVGAGAMAGLGAAATYAMGKVFARHFEGGGTLSSFDISAAKAEIKSELAEASPARS